MLTVGDVAFFQSSGRFKVFDATLAESVNDHAFIHLRVDARDFRVNAELLHNLVKYLHRPVQMRCCAGAAGRADQHGNLRFLSGLHDELEIPLDHRAGGKALPAAEVIRTGIDRAGVKRDHIKAMLERRLHGMNRETIAQHPEGGIYCCHSKRLLSSKDLGGQIGDLRHKCNDHPDRGKDQQKRDRALDDRSHWLLFHTGDLK